MAVPTMLVITTQRSCPGLTARLPPPHPLLSLLKGPGVHGSLSPYPFLHAPWETDTGLSATKPDMPPEDKPTSQWMCIAVRERLFFHPLSF